ncbi:hypothetical protein G3I60_05210 [Streptomyces sp. SID13666]|uniref:hypothetical protein n=1 Tax=Streptomyces sp. SID13666 TaxID=2706054 RepID=UPI0013C08452|nr:hypothetical protein [Streptomyces sp. SID13666]NEA53569.1 hypothetical protein [Streptomyces sp. SID13666]
MTIQQPDVVPYMVAWSTEKRISRLLLCGPGGIHYADEQSHDRDSGGALWVGTTLGQGRGRPNFAHTHAQRQRRCMRLLLCHVCGGPADWTGQGVLWLVEDNRADWPNWPENLVTVHPPICLPCSRQALRLCPHLAGNGVVAVRATESAIEGVYGQIYRQGPRSPVEVRKDTVFYDSPEIWWVLAAQLIRTLRGCTVVDLAAATASI